MSYILFLFCSHAILFYLIAFLLGMGFGYIGPAFQTMFINLAGHNQRGTANATYYTFWDFGIGLGTAIGGTIIEKFNFEWLYTLCGIALVLGVVWYAAISAGWFEREKLR